MANKYPKTFMLLPDYTYEPNKNILLGTLLPLSKESGLPNPDFPINADSRVALEQDDIIRRIEKPWSFSNKAEREISGGLDAEIPFGPVTGNSKYGRSKDDNLTVTSAILETERFVPSYKYLQKALSNDFVREYCRQEWFPSVYLVTGIKVAHQTVIEENRGRGHDGELGLQVDATGFGVPLKAGPTGGFKSNEQKRVQSSIKEPFILAYQLKRLRLKKKDAALKKMEEYNKHALLDEEPHEEPGTLEQEWDIEDVHESTDHLD